MIDSSFAGLGNPPPSSGDVIPPDTMGAAGPNHLVSLLNSDFGIFDKASGARLDNVDLQVFWSSLGTGPGQPAHFPFDTKILYDQHSARFVAMTLGGTSAGSSWIMIAVSSSSDPTGTWNKWAIPSDLDNNAWADYPGLGLDASNVYLSTNLFNDRDFFQYSKVWVLPKPQLLAGSNPITWTEFRDPSGSDFDMQPAHTFGPAPAEYFIYEGGPNRLMVAWIENTSGTPLWHSPIAVTVNPYDSLNSLPGAPQLGDSRTIDTADTRLLNAVYRNGSVWATHHVLGGSGKVEVAWYRIDPAANSGSGAVVSQGRVGDPNRWYYYPSIAVNKDDVAAIGFSGSSATEYAGAYYTIIRPQAGAAEPVALLKTGEAPYYKTLTGPDNRWGDFSATVVDPTDDATFWTLQEYAKPPITFQGTARSQWGTWWGKFHPSDVTPPTGLTATAATGPQIALSWTDSSGNELGFRIERRRMAAEGYSVVATVGSNVTSFTDNASSGLLAGFTYSYRVQAYDANGGSYSGEAVASTAPAPSPPSSGDGGGGCLSISRVPAERTDASSAVSLCFLFLPAAVCGGRRLIRSRKKY